MRILSPEVTADRIEQLLGEPVELVSTRAIKPKFLQLISKDLEYV